ncbi:MAG: UDP-N-acetylmuramate:L-alanyl-gamma-D-glutamyl-meso-diaminopimelate ligase, partial [Gemmatimonadetes bacterium]|nr:UDP-N-acetylmuramate:L-alanyl-gamma-D-glutamyl-meso-diaminopimelate ligase [Gemmatimonadota bacterium]
PTAVEQTLLGLRQTYPEAGFWVVFEPASATNARATFESRYVQAFAPADHLVVTRVPRPERARTDPPFSPERLAETIRRRGGSALSIADVDEVIDHLTPGVDPGDIVVFMSNGAFGDIQHRLLSALQYRFGSEI